MTKTVIDEQPVKTVVQSKEKNHAIEILRFFFALMIVGYHIGTIYAARGLGLKATNWMAGAGEILFVFTLTAGYFMVKHFKRLQANPEYTARSSSRRAWEYLWGRIKSLLPVLALGIILGVIAVSTWNGYTFSKAFLSVVNGLWEFLGLYSAGYNAALGQSNGAMWFISALLICSYFMYFVLCKNEDLMKGFIAPFLFVFFGGWWAYTGTRASQVGWSVFGSQLAGSAAAGNGGSSAAIGFNNGLLFVLIGMSGGILIYYAVEKLKTINWTTPKRVALTILETVALVVLLAYTLNPSWFAGDYSITGTNVIPATKSFYRWTAHLLCIIVVTCTLLGEDYLTKLLNNKHTAKVFDFLGGMALYVYMIHCPFIFFIPQLYGYKAATATGVTYTFWSLYVWVVLVSVVLGAAVKYLMDTFVLGKHKKEVKSTDIATVPVVEKKQTATKTTTKKSVAKAPAKKVVPAKVAPKKAEVKKPVAPAKKVEAKPALKAPAKAPAKKPVAKKK